MYVATIIASQGAELTDDSLNIIKSNFDDVIQTKFIKTRVAADIYFKNRSLALNELSNQLKVDIIIQKTEARAKKLLICDMESTIIENEFLDEIADLLNIKQKIAEITERAMNGEINFDAALKERVNLIKDVPEADISNLLKTRLKYNQGAKELIAACRKAGIYTMLVSGGFTIFTDYVAKELGFDESHANYLVFKNGGLDHVKEPILGKETKLKLLNEKARQLNIPLSQIAAIGDGANDLPMLHAAGLGIAYKAKLKVRDEIENQINNSSLEALIYAFGLIEFNSAN